jgi:putative FmdB family regulatory protein
MPIYTYRCKNCGEKFDLLIGVTSDKEEYKCKKCHSENIEKTLSPFSVGTSSNISNSSNLSCPTGTCSLE